VQPEPANADEKTANCGNDQSEDAHCDLTRTR
jgi:hypothetical protein